MRQITDTCVPYYEVCHNDPPNCVVSSSRIDIFKYVFYYSICWAVLT